MTIWSKFGTFNRGINIEHKQMPKNILTDDENCRGTQYIKSFFFLVFACADIKFLKNRSPKASNLA